MANARRAVLQIAIIKSQTGIEKDFFNAATLRDFNLPRKKIFQHLDWIAAQIKIVNFAHIFSGDKTNDNGSIVRSGDKALALELERRGYDWVTGEAA